MRNGSRVEIVGSDPRTWLKNCAKHIEHKFSHARQFEIDAEYLMQILQNLTWLEPYVEEENSVETAKEICASAISLYYEPDNRPYFFRQLKTIAALLNDLA